MSQARFTLTGTARELSGAEQEAAKQTFLKRNPDSFWVNFGDFSWWRLEDLVSVRFVLGFAQAGQVGLACLSSCLLQHCCHSRLIFPETSAVTMCRSPRRTMLRHRPTL